MTRVMKGKGLSKAALPSSVKDHLDILERRLARLEELEPQIRELQSAIRPLETALDALI